MVVSLGIALVLDGGRCMYESRIMFSSIENIHIVMEHQALLSGLCDGCKGFLYFLCLEWKTFRRNNFRSLAVESVSRAASSYLYCSRVACAVVSRASCTCYRPSKVDSRGATNLALWLL